MYMYLCKGTIIFALRNGFLILFTLFRLKYAK